MKATYYETEGFKVGDLVTLHEEDELKQPFKCMRIRRICKKTIHIEWVGDGEYYGYVNKLNPDRGIIFHQHKFDEITRKVRIESAAF